MIKYFNLTLTVSLTDQNDRRAELPSVRGVTAGRFGVLTRFNVQ